MGEVDVQDLKKRVDHLQYDEIDGMRKDINCMKITLSNNDLLTKQSVESNQKLRETLETVKTAMIELGQTVREGNQITEQLSGAVKDLNCKVNDIDDRFCQVEGKIQRIDEKSKIDILTWVKGQWFGIIMGVGALVYAISQIIK